MLPGHWRGRRSSTGQFSIPLTARQRSAANPSTIPLPNQNQCDVNSHPWWKSEGNVPLIRSCSFTQFPVSAREANVRSRTQRSDIWDPPDPICLVRWSCWVTLVRTELDHSWTRQVWFKTWLSKIRQRGALCVWMWALFNALGGEGFCEWTWSWYVKYTPHLLKIVLECSRKP